MGEPHSLSGWFWEDKISFPPSGTEPWFLGCTVYGLPAVDYWSSTYPSYAVIKLTVLQLVTCGMISSTSLSQTRSKTLYTDMQFSFINIPECDYVLVTRLSCQQCAWAGDKGPETSSCRLHGCCHQTTVYANLRCTAALQIQHVAKWRWIAQH